MLSVFQLLLFCFQVASTFGVLLVLYLVLALLDYRGGLDNLVGFTIWQPLLGAALCLLTILGCFLLGLPLRFSARLRLWWQQHWYLALGGAAVGLGLLVLSLLLGGDSPHLFYALSGWFLLAFSLLHLVPPLHLLPRWIPFRK